MSGADSELPAVAPIHGTTVGPWLILARLDAGSFGIVYRARRAGHPEAAPVALKLAKNPRDPRFEREGELLRRVGPHPAVPRFEDQGLWTGREGQHKYPYLVMEWVAGLPLYDWFQAQRRTSRDVLRVLAQVASALARAHAKGAVHRDVKGDNIRVTAQGRAVLLDWGSGWFPAARPLTDTTAPPGTSAYRPPEQRAFMWQFRRDMEARWHSTPSDDLYALGVTLYRLLTGVYLPPCTDGGEPVEREVMPPSAWATMCLELEALTLRLISDDRKARGTAEQLARECYVLVDTAGPEADKPILPTTHALPTDSCSSSAHPSGSSDTEPSPQARRAPAEEKPVRRLPSVPPVPAWLSWATVAVCLGLLTVAGLELRAAHPPKPWLAEPWELDRFDQAPRAEALDAGVGEEALSSAQDVPRVGPFILALGRPMPKKPAPGQRRPPCELRVETEINGACWVRVHDQSPPCGEKMYDWEGGCYLASYPDPGQPTSDKP